MWTWGNCTNIVSIPSYYLVVAVTEIANSLHLAYIIIKSQQSESRRVDLVAKSMRGNFLQFQPFVLTGAVSVALRRIVLLKGHSVYAGKSSHLITTM